MNQYLKQGYTSHSTKYAPNFLKINPLVLSPSTTRYVPQSRYFQSQELAVQGYKLEQTMIDQLNQQKSIVIEQVLRLNGEANHLLKIRKNQND